MSVSLSRRANSQPQKRNAKLMQTVIVLGSCKSTVFPLYRKSCSRQESAGGEVGECGSSCCCCCSTCSNMPAAACCVVLDRWCRALRCRAALIPASLARHCAHSQRTFRRAHAALIAVSHGLTLPGAACWTADSWLRLTSVQKPSLQHAASTCWGWQGTAVKAAGSAGRC